MLICVTICKLWKGTRKTIHEAGFMKYAKAEIFIVECAWSKKKHISIISSRMYVLHTHIWLIELVNMTKTHHNGMYFTTYMPFLCIFYLNRNKFYSFHFWSSTLENLYCKGVVIPTCSVVVCVFFPVCTRRHRSINYTQIKVYHIVGVCVSHIFQLHWIYKSSLQISANTTVSVS